MVLFTKLFQCIFFLFLGFGRKDVVEHLLQMGANVHARDDGGLIPLHNACSFGHAEVVSLLLCQGADPNARDNWNYTPLHEAAIKGKIDVCIGKYYLMISKLLDQPDRYNILSKGLPFFFPFSFYCGGNRVLSE